MSALPIEKMLTISTSHVRSRTSQGLDRGHYDLIVYSHADNGWLIFAGTKESGFAWDNAAELPDELRDSLKFAAESGCEWLLLDRDATEVVDLETFKW